ncbi:hypothetical protein L3X38_022928 [Prunus dulcis]|uniref:UDP-Glycosyltransferase superfamily protein n=1 Tax=Prunus dulcis TaxID=3755 RepID=A0AAD4Z522_PRUDU|nr:hypothetical protein L3X38_022928 [Prunus dulcis]
MAAKGGKRGRACVVVLGDIGRSPRMQYHALSLARQVSLEVDIVAYGGSEPHSAVLEHQSIHIHKMQQWPTFPRGIPAPDVFLVQNPPSVPTLVAVKCASWLRRSALLSSPICGNIHRWFERHFGKMADGSLCVTRAMQHELAQNWGIKATVLYDQPPEFFRPASLEEKHKLFCRLDKSLRKPLGVQDCTSTGTGEMLNKDINETVFSTLVGTDITSKLDRPALIVSSTSWTPDEDFGILLEAAVMYDRRVAAILNEDDSIQEEALWKEMQSGKQYLYPRLLFVITGKGPEKEKGSADLGVCLHTSSSGLDLPMKVQHELDTALDKIAVICIFSNCFSLSFFVQFSGIRVVDMFGCGLPVCAVSYSCIKELVQVEKNGLLFSSSSELADELLMLFKGFPDACDSLKGSP